MAHELSTDQQHPSRRTVQAALRGEFPPLGAVLFVCTGNICRSAYAEHALRGRLERTVPGRIEVASMGTQPNQALRVPPELLNLGPARGVRGLEAHTPQRLIPAAVAGADLVLTATTAHSKRVLSDVASANRRTFTMLEFGTLIRLLDERTDGMWHQPGIGVRSLAQTAARHRVLARSEMESLDLADPFGRGAQDYEHMARALEPALEATASALERAVSGSASGRPAARR